MTPQKVNNHTMEDLLDSEGDKFSVTKVRRMMIRKFNELKEDLQKQPKESQELTECLKNNLVSHCITI
jgi:hypothetical protein